MPVRIPRKTKKILLKLFTFQKLNPKELRHYLTYLRRSPYYGQDELAYKYVMTIVRDS